jgi:hypothetical protein
MAADRRRTVAESSRRWSVSARSWQRAGAAGGIGFVLLTVATFFTPSTPDADEPAARIAAAIAGDRTGHVIAFYVSGIAWLLFLLFVAALWGGLRRAGSAPEASALVLLGGVAVYAGVQVESAAHLALANAADAGRDPAAVRALFELAEVMLVPLRFALAALFGGIALTAIPVAALGRRLGWTAAGLAVLLVVGLLGVFAGAEDDGPLVPILVLGRLGALVWVLWASIAMLRPARADALAGGRPAGPAPAAGRG